MIDVNCQRRKANDATPNKDLDHIDEAKGSKFMQQVKTTIKGKESKHMIYIYIYILICKVQLFQSYHLKPKNILGTTKKKKKKNKWQKQKRKALQVVASSLPTASTGAP